MERVAAAAAWRPLLPSRHGAPPTRRRSRRRAAPAAQVEAGLEFRDQAVATTVCAFTALACHHARLFDTLAAYTAQHVGRFNEQGISNVAWAYSLMEAMMRSCPEQVLQLDPGGAAPAAPGRALRRADGPVLVPAWGLGGGEVSRGLGAGGCCCCCCCARWSTPVPGRARAAAGTAGLSCCLGCGGGGQPGAARGMVPRHSAAQQGRLMCHGLLLLLLLLLLLQAAQGPGEELEQLLALPEPAVGRSRRNARAAAGQLLAPLLEEEPQPAQAAAAPAAPAAAAPAPAAPPSGPRALLWSAMSKQVAHELASGGTYLGMAQVRLPPAPLPPAAAGACSLPAAAGLLPLGLPAHKPAQPAAVRCLPAPRSEPCVCPPALRRWCRPTGWQAAATATSPTCQRAAACSCRLSCTACA